MKKSIIANICFILLLSMTILHSGEKGWFDGTYHAMTTDDVTFESFYKESSSVDWERVALWTAGAAAVTGVVILSVGTAAPALAGVASIMEASSVAGVFSAGGLAGGAATASGLATMGSLVGGGMASGLIITGGIMGAGHSLTDYTVNKVLSAYSYSNFKEESKQLMTLPLPLNNKGSEDYEKAMKVLNAIDSTKNITIESNQQIIKDTLTVFNPIPKEEYLKAKKVVSEMGVSDAWNDPDKFNINNDLVSKYEEQKALTADEKSKNKALQSILYFIANDYLNAKKYAKESINFAKEEDVKYTLPSYIYAVSSLYEDNFDIEDITNEYFKYSVVEEHDNPMIPLLFTIYLDRMMYRLNDGYLNSNALDEVYDVAENSALKDQRLPLYTVLISRYLLRLKLEKQKISALTTAENTTIKNSEKTLNIVNKSYSEYTKLLETTEEISEELTYLAEDTDETKVIEEVKKISSLVLEYENERSKLKQLKSDLTTYQDSLNSDEIIQDEDDSSFDLLDYLVLFGFMLYLVFFFSGKNKEKTKNYSTKCSKT